MVGLTLAAMPSRGTDENSRNSLTQNSLLKIGLPTSGSPTDDRPTSR
jgi:hypothetical protein